MSTMPFVIQHLLPFGVIRVLWPNTINQLSNKNCLRHGALQWKEIKAHIWPSGKLYTKNLQHMPGNIPLMADPVVHLLLLKTTYTLPTYDISNDVIVVHLTL